MTHNNQQELTISNKYAGVLDINIPDNINEINLTGYHEGVTLKLIPNEEGDVPKEYPIDDFIGLLKDTHDYQDAYQTYDMNIDVYAMNKDEGIIKGYVVIKESLTGDLLLISKFNINLPTKDNPHFFLHTTGVYTKEIDLTDKPSLTEKADFFKRQLFDEAIGKVLPDEQD